MLYGELLRLLAEIGITNAYACVAISDNYDEYLTSDSIDFHRSMGFEYSGVLHKCGEKFGRRYDIVWAERFITSADK